MRDIDFDDVTIDIEDYLEGVIISSTGDNARHCSPNFQKILNSKIDVQNQINNTNCQNLKAFRAPTLLEHLACANLEDLL